MTPHRGPTTPDNDLTTIWHQCGVENADAFMAWHYTALVLLLMLYVMLWLRFRQVTRTNPREIL